MNFTRYVDSWWNCLFSSVTQIPYFVLPVGKSIPNSVFGLTSQQPKIVELGELILTNNSGAAANTRLDVVKFTDGSPTDLTFKADWKITKSIDTSYNGFDYAGATNGLGAANVRMYQAALGALPSIVYCGGGTQFSIPDNDSIQTDVVKGLRYRVDTPLTSLQYTALSLFSGFSAGNLAVKMRFYF